MERAAHSRDDWTLLRVTTPDRPGGLAVFARCMAACGVDILSIEILGHEGPKAVADVLVHGGDLDRALRALDEDLDLLGRRIHGELPDPALAMAEACGLVYADRSADALLLAAMRPGRRRRRRRSTGSRRRAGPRARRRPAGLESLAAQSWSAARRAFAEPRPAPRWRCRSARGRELVLAVARGQTFPFQAAEVDRLAALGRLALPVL